MARPVFHPQREAIDGQRLTLDPDLTAAARDIICTGRHAGPAGVAPPADQDRATL